MKKELLKIQKFVEKNFKYVGKDFSREVRKVYYDKKGDKKPKDHWKKYIKPKSQDSN